METKTVGDRIKVLCSVLGISQQTIATLTGVKLTVINKAARNVYTPAIQVLRDIATGLMVSESWLALGEGRIFPGPFVLLTATVESGRQPGGRSQMMSAREAHDLVEYLFDAEGVESCSVVRDARRPDPLYYVCHRSQQDAFLVLLSDRLTSPGIEALLVEKNIETNRISAVDEDGDEDHSPALNIYISLSELYLPNRYPGEALKKLRTGAEYLIPELAKTLEHLNPDDIVSPGRLAANHKVQLLVKVFEELNVEEDDIEEAIKIYLR